MSEQGSDKGRDGSRPPAGSRGSKGSGRGDGRPPAGKGGAPRRASGAGGASGSGARSGAGAARGGKAAGRSNDRDARSRFGSGPRGSEGDESQRRSSVRATGVERERIQAPQLPEDVDPTALDGDVRAELRSLTKASADDVALHLAATAMLLDEDPEAAYQHAVYARARASRVGSVREAVGLTAYLTGRYAEALSELRAVRRIHGSDVHLPVMADCQRGLGRPERALEMAGSPEAAALPVAGQVEMRIVASGARQDLGQPDAAVLTLRCPQLKEDKAEWAPRLRYAYAEALITAGQVDEGREWMAKAAAIDEDGLTYAAERLAELDGITFTETVDEVDLVDSTVEDVPPVEG